MNTPRAMLMTSDPEFREVVQTRLGQAGVEVFSCSQQRAAIALLARKRPHLVLLDLDEVGDAGFLFHECLQYSDRGRGIPVIYLGSQDGPGIRRHALEQGAFGLLVKPYDPQELISLVRRSLAFAGRDQQPSDSLQAASSRPR